jgi:hypothetical protein
VLYEQKFLTTYRIHTRTFQHKGPTKSTEHFGAVRVRTREILDFWYWRVASEGRCSHKRGRRVSEMPVSELYLIFTYRYLKTNAVGLTRIPILDPNFGNYFFIRSPNKIVVVYKYTSCKNEPNRSTNILFQKKELLARL